MEIDYVTVEPCRDDYRYAWSVYAHGWDGDYRFRRKIGDFTTLTAATREFPDAHLDFATQLAVRGPVIINQED